MLEVGLIFSEEFECAFGFGGRNGFFLTHEKLLLSLFAFVVTSHFELKLIEYIMSTSNSYSSLLVLPVLFLQNLIHLI